MADVFSAILNFFKPGIPLYVAVALVCAAVFLLPTPAIEALGLIGIVEGNKGYFGLAFLFSSALTITFGAAAVRNSGFFQRMAQNCRQKNQVKQVRRSFDELGTDEKFLLYLVVHSHEHMFHYPPQDKTIQTLIDKGWVEYDYGGYLGDRFKIPWERWRALGENRAYIRLKAHYPDSDQSEIERVAELYRGSKGRL